MKEAMVRLTGEIFLCEMFMANKDGLIRQKAWSQTTECVVPKNRIGARGLPMTSLWPEIITPGCLARGALPRFNLGGSFFHAMISYRVETEGPSPPGNNLSYDVYEKIRQLSLEGDTTIPHYARGTWPVQTMLNDLNNTIHNRPRCFSIESAF